MKTRKKVMVVNCSNCGNKLHGLTACKRSDKSEPQPMEMLEYIACAVQEIAHQRCEAVGIGALYQTWRDSINSITLGEIRAHIAHSMAKSREYLTSAYRHEVSPLHSLVYRILTDPVELNALIEKARLEPSTEVKR